MKIRILLISLVLLISCHRFETDQMITYDLTELPEISKVKLSDLGFDDISYIPLETIKQSAVCEFTGLFTDNRLIVGKKFFLVVCHNQIFKFLKDGTFDRMIGKIGRGPDEFMVAHDVDIDEKTNFIYVLARWQKKIFVYSENGDMIRTIQFPFPSNKLSFCKDGILCYSQNFMSNIDNSFNLIDTNGILIKSFPNRYPFKFNDASAFRGENLFYNFNGELFKKEIYSDTIFLFKNQVFSPYLAIQIGKKLLTVEARSNFDGLYLYDNYIYPLNLFEFGDYIYFDFCYSIRIPDEVLTYRFIGSKKDNSFNLIDYDEGIFNDLDGGPNVLPKACYNDNTIVSVVDALKFKNHVNSEFFRKSEPKYPERKKELEQLASKISELDNPILVLVSRK